MWMPAFRVFRYFPKRSTAWTRPKVQMNDSELALLANCGHVERNANKLVTHQ